MIHLKFSSFVCVYGWLLYRINRLEIRHNVIIIKKIWLPPKHNRSSKFTVVRTDIYRKFHYSQLIICYINWHAYSCYFIYINHLYLLYFIYSSTNNFVMYVICFICLWYVLIFSIGILNSLFLNIIYVRACVHVIQMSNEQGPFRVYPKFTRYQKVFYFRNINFLYLNLFFFKYYLKKYGEMWFTR